MSKTIPIQLKGLTRETIYNLLEIYNRNIVPESHAQKEAGAGNRINAPTLKKIVSTFGINFSDEEARRAIVSFSRGDALTFDDFINFYLWFISIKPKLLERTKCAFLSVFSDDSSKIGHEIIKSPFILKSNIAGYLQFDLVNILRTKFNFGSSTSTSSSSNEAISSSPSAIQKKDMKSNKNYPSIKISTEALHQKIIEDLNQLPKSVTQSHQTIKLKLQFNVTLWNVFGLLPFEYIGIENDLPGLDVFVQIELCDQLFKSAVFPARYSPSISQTFSFDFSAANEISFLDASWWVQTNFLKISVYAVHYLDDYVAYHLLGVANQPLVPLLIGGQIRSSCAINLQPMTPSFPIPILISVVDTNYQNPLIYHSTPIEQLIFQKFFVQIRSNLLQTIFNETSFIQYCEFFKGITVHFPAREYQLLGFDQMNIAHMIDEYIFPKGLKYYETRNRGSFKTDNDDDIIHHNKEFITKLIYTINLRGYSIFDRPEPAVMQIRSLIATKTCGLDPNNVERAILLCNLLIGYGINAYVCIGDHQFQRYVWVMTDSCERLSYSTVPDFMMFDCGNHAYSVSSFSHHQFEFPTPSVIERVEGQQKIIFSHGINPLLVGINTSNPPGEQMNFREKVKDNTRNTQSKKCHWSISGIWPDRVPCGLKVATVFNAHQIYCNIQNCDDIEVVKWDFDDINLWAPFYSAKKDESKVVYPELSFKSFLRKPITVFSNEENIILTNLMTKTVFKMFQKTTFQRLDKFTKDRFIFEMNCSKIYEMENLYRVPNYLKTLHKSHLHALLDTQLLLKLTPIQRQILDSYLMCKEMFNNLLESEQENDQLSSEISPPIKILKSPGSNSNSDNKSKESVFDKNAKRKKRTKLLTKAHEQNERDKLNESIIDIYFSILNSNLDGHCDFIERESLIRFFLIFNIVRCESDKEAKNNLKKCYKEAHVEFLKSLHFQREEYESHFSYSFLSSAYNMTFNFNTSESHIKQNIDENAKLFFEEENKIVRKDPSDLLIKLVDKINEDEFNMISNLMEKSDSSFKGCLNDGIIKRIAENYVKTKKSENQYLMIEIFLQHLESNVKKSDLEECLQCLTHNEKHEDKGKEINELMNKYLLKMKENCTQIKSKVKEFADQYNENDTVELVPNSAVITEIRKYVKFDGSTNIDNTFTEFFPSEINEIEQNEILSLLEMRLTLLFNAVYDQKSAFIESDPEIIKNAYDDIGLFLEKTMKKSNFDLIKDYSKLSTSSASKTIKEYSDIIDTLITWHNYQNINSIPCEKYAMAILFKKALVFLQKRPEISLPYPKDWKIRFDSEKMNRILVALLARFQTNQAATLKNLIKQPLSKPIVFINNLLSEAEFANYKNEHYFLLAKYNFAMKVVFNLNKIVKLCDEIIPISDSKVQKKFDNIYKIFRRLLLAEERVELDLYLLNSQICFLYHQNIVSISNIFSGEGGVECVNKHLDIFIRRLLNFCVTSENFGPSLKRKMKLIKRRIESFRLTNKLINNCSSASSSSSFSSSFSSTASASNSNARSSASLQIPDKIIVKPPEMFATRPNSASNLYMTQRLMIEHLMKNRFIFGTADTAKKYQKIQQLIQSLHICNETSVPYHSFGSRQDKYTQFIDEVKSDPGIRLNSHQSKVLRNLFKLDVAMSTGTNSLIFNQKWSEGKLVKKMQKTLVKFEEDVISTGRYDVKLLHSIVNKSIRSHRYMMRVSKHKVDDPTLLADQLSLSGALTSACGAERCIMIVQPFRYRIDARSTWVVLLFIYKIPDLKEKTEPE